MTQKSAMLNFPKTHVDTPYMSRVIRNFDVEVNILQASVTPEEDGRMFAIFKGELEAVDKALSYLKESGIGVVLPAKNLLRDDDRCVHCSACVGQCPSGAFSVEKETHFVIFHPERCIACELCIPACSYGAIESINEHFRKTGGV